MRARCRGMDDVSFGAPVFWTSISTTCAASLLAERTYLSSTPIRLAKAAGMESAAGLIVEYLSDFAERAWRRGYVGTAFARWPAWLASRSGDALSPNAHCVSGFSAQGSTSDWEEA